MGKKRVSLGVMIALIAVTAAITLSLTYQYALSRFNRQIMNLVEREKIYEKLSQIDSKTRENFYYHVDEDELIEAIANGYVDGLGDSYSAYLSAENAKQVLQELEGQGVGIGIEIYFSDDGRMLITRAMKNSPAALAGLTKGDEIISVDGHLVSENSKTDMLAYLSGEIGSSVSVSVKREGVEELITTQIVRKSFAIETVTYRVLENGIGYIKIYEFSENTGREFNEAMTSLVKSGVKGFVLDVRDNPGGLVSSVAEVLDVILPSGNLVFAEYKSGGKKVMYTSDSSQIDVQIAVLINENSASGAELLAAAVRDYGRGKLVGQQTYGKGTMQEYYTFSDNSALRLTVAKFYPPLGPNFDGEGVAPDIAIEQSAEAKKNPYFVEDALDLQLSAASSALIASGGGEYPGGAGGSEDTGSEAASSSEVAKIGTDSSIVTCYEPIVKQTYIA